MTLELRVLGHLLANAPAPLEWIEFVLMDRFKWSVEYARSLPAADGLRLLTMMGAEAQAIKAKAG